MAEISEGLPDYLKTSYSIVHSKSVRFSRKSLKTPLTQGISSEAPDFFRVSQVPVITPENRKKIYLTESDRFLSDLKKNQISPSKKFQYSDYHNSKYDYDSLSCANRIDLTADRKPGLKKIGGFVKFYQKFLDTGFGVIRGEFTVETNNPKVLKNHSGKVKTLMRILKKTGQKKAFSRKTTTPRVKNRKQEIPVILKPKKSISAEKILQDLEFFEEKLRKNTPLAERRQVYTFK